MGMNGGGGTKFRIEKEEIMKSPSIFCQDNGREKELFWLECCALF